MSDWAPEEVLIVLAEGTKTHLVLGKEIQESL